MNIHATAAQTISIDLGELKAAKVSGRILSGSKLQDYNSFDKPNTLAPKAFNGAKLNGSKLELSLPAFSVVVLELE